MDEYLKESAELVNSIPIEVMEPIDQLKVLYAYMELAEKVRPIYEKYQSKKKTYFVKNSKED
jgi:hypothetical protein